MNHRERIPASLGVCVAVVLVLIPVAAAEAGDPVAGDPFPIFSNPDDGLGPAVAYNSVRGVFLVAWEWDGNIFGRIVTQHGRTGTTTFTFVTTGINHHPDVASNSCVDEHLVVREDDSANTWGARLDGAGTTIPGGRFLIAGGRAPHRILSVLCASSVTSECLLSSLSVPADAVLPQSTGARLIDSTSDGSAIAGAVRLCLRRVPNRGTIPIVDQGHGRPARQRRQHRSITACRPHCRARRATFFLEATEA